MERKKRYYTKDLDTIEESNENSLIHSNTQNEKYLSRNRMSSQNDQKYKNIQNASPEKIGFSKMPKFLSTTTMNKQPATSSEKEFSSKQITPINSNEYFKAR